MTVAPGVPSVFRSRRALSVVFAVHGAGQASVASRIPWIADHASLTQGQLSIVLTAPALGAVVAMQFGPMVVGRLGISRVLRALLPLWALLLLLPAVARTAWLVGAALLLLGALASLTDMAMNAEGVEVGRALARPVISTLHGMWSVGALAAGGISALVASYGTDAVTHLAATGLVLAALSLGATRFIPVVRQPVNPEARRSGLFSVPRGPVLLIALAASCAVFVEGAAINWSAIFLVRVVDSSEAGGAIAFASFSGAEMLALFLGDRMVARFGSVRTARASGVVGLAGSVLVITSSNVVAAVLGFALIGTGVANIVALAFAAAGHTAAAESERAKAIAAVATISYVSGLAAPATIGGVAAATTLASSFGIVALMFLAITAGARVLRAGH